MTGIPRGDGWSERISTVWVWLAKITHPLLDDAIRVTVDSADVTYGGEVYSKGRFGLVPPNFAEGNQTAQIRVANTDRKAGSAIQQMHTPAELTLAIVDASDPDTGATEWPPMLLGNASGNAVEITGEFRSRVEPQVAWPKQRADKATAPGLYV